MKTVSLLAVAILAIASMSEAKGTVGCYFGSWAVYRQGPGNFDASDIDPTLCNIIYYSFAKLSWEGEVQVYDDYNDVGDEWHEGQFKKLQELRPKSPNTKIVIAIGGWNHGPGSFQAVVVDANKRQKFADSAVAFCRKYGFDGIDIDWEYQDSVGGTPEQKAGFSETLRVLSQRFKTEGLFLSCATPANFNLMDVNYDWKVVSQTVDSINLMAYDLHGAWETHTGHHAALYPLDSEVDYDRNLNVMSILKRYIEFGADPKKISLGLPIYGRGFTLADRNNHGLYAPATGPSQMGQYVPEAGILGYDEICKNRWPETTDAQQKSPYAYQGDQWVGYESLQSLTNKINTVRNELGITNFFVWSVETDDFSGACGGTAFPFLRTINANI